MSGLADLFPKQEEQSIPSSLDELDQLVKESNRIIANATHSHSLVASDASVAESRNWPVLHHAALHGLAGDVVRTIEPHSEGDPAAILLQWLIATGNLLGPAPHFRVEATRHCFNLYCVLVGETSKGRKGTSWAHIPRICALADEGWAQGCITSGLSSSEGLIHEVSDERQADRRLLIVQTEFASVLKVASREGNNLSSTLRDAWDSGNLRTLVKNNPTRATGAHISIIGHITRGELIRYLSDTETHNGFANRMLWGCVRRSKCLPEGGKVPESDLNQLGTRLREVSEWARQVGSIELSRNDAARDLWASVYPELSAGMPGLLGAATSRAEAQVLRLSALYALLDRTATVTPDHLKAALAVWDYCFASAQYIFGNAIGDPVADRIREALLNVGIEGMTRTQIRDLFKRHESADRIGQALSTLAALGMAMREQISTGGRDSELWIATEAISATKD